MPRSQCTCDNAHSPGSARTMHLCMSLLASALAMDALDILTTSMHARACSCDGAYSIVDGKRVLNLASINFLSLGVAPETLHAAQQTVEKYGVGSCGPRGFYGTIDVHLQLEARLAEFMVK